MSLVLRRVSLCVLVCCVLFAGRVATGQTALPSLSDPTISPDGKEIAFVSGGDIWTVASGGGEAHLLVTHPATESRPLCSPDATKLAFVSPRTSVVNSYVLTLATRELTWLTYLDRSDSLYVWSHYG